MKILVTGAKGFIGKNLIAQLKNEGYKEIYEYDLGVDEGLLDRACREIDFVFHLAGVCRPEKEEDFMGSNYGFTSDLLEKLKTYKNLCPVMISSSIQADLDNPYGKSKKAGEELLIDYGKKSGAKVFIYRFPNVFGKWSRPNYNSAVATFCHNIARDLPIRVNDPDTVMNLIYIDDLVKELTALLKDGVYKQVEPVYTIKLGEIVNLIYSFKKSREDNHIPDMTDSFTKKLYSTYLSFLPEDKFSYDLKMNTDNRGSFTEFIKIPEGGQVSVNISKSGVTKGDHWHHTKNEKFLVVSGSGVIRLRKINSDEVIEYFVSGDKLEVIDIPVGYTHNIENREEGGGDMITVIWANEIFDPDNPDTYFEKV